MGTSGEFDVILCGYGPVGAIMANLLGHSGYRVLVLDKGGEVYGLPRAAGLDAEAARTLQIPGLTEKVLEHTTPAKGADFVSSKHERLMGVRFEQGGRFLGRYGWPPTNFIYQPDVDRVLRGGLDRYDHVTVKLRHEVTGFTQDDDGVDVTARDLESGGDVSFRGRYLLGGDGARSFVRSELGASWNSLGYDCDWLVVDVRMNVHKELPDVAQQICAPKRRATFIPMTGPYRRWEFQLQEGETREQFENHEKIWDLLADWIQPGDAEILRGVVYQFHAAVADRWRDRRVLLLGDAAHQMPPFLGQGMCSGIRDAVNLWWKLRLVLDGVASEKLLDAYQLERSAHATELVAWAVATGQAIDAFADAEAAGVEVPKAASEASYGGSREIPPLLDGVVQAGQAGANEHVGMPLPQPRVKGPSGVAVLLDEVLGEGFAIVAREDPKSRLDPEVISGLERIGTRFVAIPRVDEVDPWLQEILGVHDAVVVRPDRYVFGVTTPEVSLPDLATNLVTQVLGDQAGDTAG